MTETFAIIPKDWKAFDKYWPRWVIKKRIPIQVIELSGPVVIETPEGDMRAEAGDFLAKGVEGEFYPIKRSVFYKTYEAYIEGEREAVE